MKKPPRFSPELVERAVRMVVDAREQRGSEWATIMSVSSKVGCTDYTLWRWVRQHQTVAGQRPRNDAGEAEADQGRDAPDA